MEYAEMTFWLLVIVFAALGVHRLWSSLIQPKVVNSILLPGTLVAQLGYVLGLLVTGGTVNNTSLVKDDDSGEPQTGGKDVKTRVPLIGTIIIALLPMVGCAVAIYWVSRYFGASILGSMENTSVADFALPTTFSLFFEIMRNSLGLVERLVNVVRSHDLTNWRTLMFLYLVVCLTVRMAPLTGNLRGSLCAIFLTGILAFLIGQMVQTSSKPLECAWPLITFSVAVLLFLLIVSLLVKGIVCLIKTVGGAGGQTGQSKRARAAGDR